MKYKVLPNRTISDKKKGSDKKKVILKEQEMDKSSLDAQKESGRIPTKFQVDDDYDNWFPWETY
jgi:hypothetical protein